MREGHPTLANKMLVQLPNIRSCVVESDRRCASAGDNSCSGNVKAMRQSSVQQQEAAHCSCQGACADDERSRSLPLHAAGIAFEAARAATMLTLRSIVTHVRRSCCLRAVCGLSAAHAATGLPEKYLMNTLLAGCARAHHCGRNMQKLEIVIRRGLELKQCSGERAPGAKGRASTTTAASTTASSSAAPARLGTITVTAVFQNNRIMRAVGEDV